MTSIIQFPTSEELAARQSRSLLEALAKTLVASTRIGERATDEELTTVRTVIGEFTVLGYEMGSGEWLFNVLWSQAVTSGNPSGVVLTAQVDADRRFIDEPPNWRCQGMWERRLLNAAA